jgi:hypothetical protein
MFLKRERTWEHSTINCFNMNCINIFPSLLSFVFLRIGQQISVFDSSDDGILRMRCIFHSFIHFFLIWHRHGLIARGLLQ